MRFYLLAFIPVFAFASEVFFTSDHVDYRDNKINLEGHVTIKHPLGVLLANHAQIEKEEGKELSPFSHIFLEKNVSLLLNDHSSLHADEAVIETSGVHFATKEDGIHFLSGHLEVKSLSAALTYKDEKPYSLQFTDKVVLLNQDIHVSADELIYTLSDKTIELLAKEGNSVVFSNQDSSVTMRGKAILISKDTTTGKPIVQGVGRIHLSITSDDKNPLPLLDQCINSLF